MFVVESHKIRKMIVDHGGSLGALDFSLYSMEDHEKDLERRLAQIEDHLERIVNAGYGGVEPLKENINKIAATLQAIEAIKSEDTKVS
ncbi:MAG: hypothetical protein ACJAS1_000576 [Oleiphilaceae bacterium]